MKVNAERLDYIDNMLLASGWQRTDIGWVAPDYMRKTLAEAVGVGSVSRSLAISAQIQIDEAITA